MKFTALAIHRTAARRPEGYLEDLLANGSPSYGANGTLESIDFTDEQYASLRTKYGPPARPQQHRAPPHGPGTELKKLLSKIGITTSPGCACNKRARVMDEKGCDWCAENLSTITAWLKEEHTRQKIMLPFSETAVSLLVRYAIRRARAIAK
jgi:hypothetical protein